jgi:subtilisin family serine protease
MLLGLAFVLCVSVPAVAGDYDQRFADLLARTPRGEMVSGLVMVDQQVDVPRLQREIAQLALTSRWRQHEHAVREAQDLATRTQSGLVEALEGWKSQGLVRSYEPFWVTNMIAVEAGRSVFDQLLARPDVGTIYENAPLQIRTGWPDDAPPVNGDRNLPDNLNCINLAPAWQMGLKGQGRLVCVFDTGVDGTHEALASRWRGAQPGVQWWEAWKDPYTGSEFPYDSGIHGTHVTGIAIGEKPDHAPVGVAPGAKWIAAGVLINFNVQKIIECYQWAVDPDGDPSTIDDVPDVINNSWGNTLDCDHTYWNAIDLVEAAGIVNTIAVDNTGPGYATVNSPESRAESPTVNFGVGNVDPHTPGYPIANGSGRGPSPCDYTSIKPEVTAPGTSINSSLPGNGYGNLSGCSMACPHVSGAVAILRQLNPDLTVDDVKTALMATAFDRGDVGEDNAYGWGIIDVGAAAQYVRTRLPNFPPESLTVSVAGDTATLNWQRPERSNPYNLLQKYRVYRAPIGESYPLTPIAEVSVASSLLQYMDPVLPDGSYKYVVTGLYVQGESGPSNEVEIEVRLPAPAPTNLTATAVADTVTLSWERPTGIHPHNLLLSYRVYRAYSGEPFPETPLTEVADTSAVVFYVDAGVPIGVWHYIVRGVFERSEGDASNEANVSLIDPAGVADGIRLDRPALDVSPNPFNPVTVIRFRTPAAGPTQIRIYAANGALVRTWDNGAAPGAFERSLVWDGTDSGGRPVASGSYWVRLEGRGIALSRRVTLLK